MVFFFFLAMKNVFYWSLRKKKEKEKQEYVCLKVCAVWVKAMLCGSRNTTQPSCGWPISIRVTYM